MADNPFEGISNFFNGIPAPQSDLTPKALESIRQIIREEGMSKRPVSEPLEENETWIARTRKTFKLHGHTIEELLKENSQHVYTFSMFKYAILASPPQDNDITSIITQYDQLLEYLEKAAETLKTLYSLARTVNAVMSEHEE